MQAKGFVHGDLRESNLKVNINTGKLVLLDFDWAGKVGIDVYPPFMNPIIPWPAGAETGKCLEYAHDEDWMARILPKYC